MKKCPYCAEEIQDEAIVCRFCGRDLHKVITDINSENFQVINGIRIDLHKIARTYPKSLPFAANFLASKTKIKPADAQKLLEPVYVNCKEQLKNVKFGESFKAQLSIGQDKLLAERQRLEDLDRQGIPYCPKCHSTSLSANKKGFGVGKAAAGAFLAGPVGLLAGGLGAQKIQVTCMNCGHKFVPGKK